MRVRMFRLTLRFASDRGLDGIRVSAVQSAVRMHPVFMG